MTNAESLPAAVLGRKAVVYVRQSSPGQVEHNFESRRRQYELAETARRRGFRTVEVIDDDLGRSASGMVARPGFDRLVAALCAGEVGGVLCFDASRLARNGRDWHHLLELCGLVAARVIDLDGVYDPRLPNDRLLLGMKGSISEFELGVIRARMLEAAKRKAARGELRIGVPIGYVWHKEYGLGFDPDERLQEAIRMVFERFRKLGSARQAFLSLAAEELSFPRPSDGKRMTSFEWTPIRYRNVIGLLKNPFYAGAYAYGKREMRVTMVDGRARKTYGHGKPMEAWEVLIKNHHEGYIDWAEFERNQETLEANTYGRVGGVKSGRGGKALLAGMLTCGRCGRGLAVVYAGAPPGRPMYRCDRPNLQLGRARCLVLEGRGLTPPSRRNFSKRYSPWRSKPLWKPNACKRKTRPKSDGRRNSICGRPGLAGRAAVCSLRPGQPFDRRPVGEALGDRAAPRRGLQGPCGGSDAVGVGGGTA